MDGRELILIDTSSPGQPGSMGRYADMVWQCAQALPGLPPVRRIRLALPDRVLRCFGPRGRTWVHHAWLLARRGVLARGPAGTVYHVLDGSHAYVMERLTGARCIVTCHDLIPLLQLEGRLPGKPGPAAVRIIRRSARALQQAGTIVTESANTGKDAEELLGIPGERICVVPIAVRSTWAGAGGGGAGPVPRRDGRQPIVLHVGNDAPYKNREGVVRVFARIRREMEARLVLAGAGPTDRLRRLAAESGVDSDIEWVASPSDERLASLYREAGVLLFPSLYEGFGWPVLEAMAAGCPVVASTAGSIPEVAGAAALLAGAQDEDALAQACSRVLRDPDCATRLARMGRERAAEFTMERMGSGLKTVYARAGIGGQMGI